MVRIGKVTPGHVKDFLLTKLGCKKSSFDAYTSALGKTDSAISKACDRPPQWKELLRDMRFAAAVTLDSEQSARAYKCCKCCKRRGIVVFIVMYHSYYIKDFRPAN